MLYLRGEIGKALGPERRPLADLKITDAVARWESLASDTLTWTARTRDVLAGETIVPEIGQKVSLYEGETRLFHGYVTAPLYNLYGARITAEGAWWFLRRDVAESEQTDDTSATADRPVVRYEAGAVSTHLATLVSQMRAAGMPVRLGTISVAYSIPTVSYSLTSWADVLARLTEWCPDGWAWMSHRALSGTVVAATSTTVQLSGEASTVDGDYVGLEIEIRSGAAAGQSRVITAYSGANRTATVAVWSVTPAAGDAWTLEVEAAVNFTRRQDADDEQLVIGDETQRIQEDFEMRALPELQASYVAVPYVDRDPLTGLTRFQQQAAGDAVAGKRAVITVSGPELADFLPFDDFDSYGYVTTAVTNVESAALLFDSQFAGAKDAGLTTELDFAGSSYGYNLGTTACGPYNAKTVTIPAGSIKNLDGTTPSFTGRVLLASVAPPDWWVELVGAIPVVCSGLWTYRALVTRYGTCSSPGSATPATPPGWLGSLNYTVRDSGFIDGPFPSDASFVQILQGSYSFETYLVPSGLGGSGTSYKPWDYDFQAPPPDLADNLLAASSWLPWTGRVTRAWAAIPTAEALARKYSVPNLWPDLVEAGAAPKAVELQTFSRRQTVEFGPPARNDFRTLVQRVRRNPQDNIVEL